MPREHIPSPQETPRKFSEEQGERGRVRRNTTTSNSVIKLEWVHGSRRGASKGLWRQRWWTAHVCPRPLSQSRSDLEDQHLLVSSVICPRFSLRLPAEVLSSGSTQSYGFQGQTPANRIHTKATRSKPDSSLSCQAAMLCLGLDSRLCL